MVDEERSRVLGPPTAKIAAVALALGLLGIALALVSLGFRG